MALSNFAGSLQWVDLLWVNLLLLSVSGGWGPIPGPFDAYSFLLLLLGGEVYRADSARFWGCLFLDQGAELEEDVGIAVVHLLGVAALQPGKIPLLPLCCAG